MLLLVASNIVCYLLHGDRHSKGILFFDRLSPNNLSRMSDFHGSDSHLECSFFGRRQEKESGGFGKPYLGFFSRGDKTSRGFSGREEGLAAWGTADFLFLEGTADFLFWKGRARNGNLYYLWVGHCGRQYSARALCSQALK